MNNNKKREINAIYTQITASIFSIITVIISILLLYNEKLDIKGEVPLFTAKSTQNLSKFNRVLFLIIAITFLLINYELYDISKNQGENLQPYKLQIIASYLTVIAASIALYIVLNPSVQGEVVDVENPII